MIKRLIHKNCRNLKVDRHENFHLYPECTAFDKARIFGCVCISGRVPDETRVI
jgi:hypothetical protein